MHNIKNACNNLLMDRNVNQELNIREEKKLVMSRSTNENCVDEKKVIRKSSDKTGVASQKQTYAYTYIVECGDGSLYTGWTNHLEERMRSHNEGKGAKYTRSRLPVRLVYYEEYATKQEAMKREYAIKQLARNDKLRLIEKQSQEVRAVCRDIAVKVQEYMDNQQ